MPLLALLDLLVDNLMLHLSRCLWRQDTVVLGPISGVDPNGWLLFDLYSALYVEKFEHIVLVVEYFPLFGNFFTQFLCSSRFRSL